MERCEHIQELLLDYLYELVEAGERAELARHFESCANCQVALQLAVEQKQRLAEAVKLTFPGVRFEPPPAVPMPAAPETPGEITVPSRKPEVRVPLVREPRYRGLWTRLAVAASLFVLVGSSIAAPGWLFVSGRATHAAAIVEAKRDSVAVRTDLEERLLPQAQARAKRTSELATAIELQREHEHAELEAARGREAAKTTVLQATSSNTFEPGGLNEVEVRAETLDRSPVPFDLSAKLVDQDNRVLCQPPQLAIAKDEEKLCYRIAFPRDLVLPPGQEVDLEINARTADGPEGVIRQLMRVSSPVYVTDLRTDKRIYKPGDTIHFRSTTFDRAMLRPPTQPMDLVFTLYDPRGRELIQLRGQDQVVDLKANCLAKGPDEKKPLRGLAAGSIPLPNPEMLKHAAGIAKEGKLKNEPGEPSDAAPLPADLLGGEYRLVVREAKGRFPPEECRFTVVSPGESAALRNEIAFNAPYYPPGAEVIAQWKAFPANSKRGKPAVQAWMNVDGKETALPESQIRPGKDGSVSVQFTLPPTVDEGRASLRLQVKDGELERESAGVVEQPIPVESRIYVEFFPESGDLIAGMANRVYFEALTSRGIPAAMTGVLIDDLGDEVRGPDGLPVTLRTELADDAAAASFGAGVFRFTPEAGRSYRVKLLEPAGVQLHGQIPTPLSDGVLLHLPKTVTSEKEPIVAQLRSIHTPKDVEVGPLSVRARSIQRSLLVGAYCRGRLLAVRSLELLDGETATVELKPEAGTGGVFRVTVFEERPQQTGSDRLVPLAERLMYRTPTEQLIISCETDREDYAPGERVAADIRTFDENEKAKPAVLLVAAVDRRFAALANDRTRRSMDTQLYLASELKNPAELEYADVLLTNHPKAKTALDLLLGIQGWRRFAEQENFVDADRLKEFKQKYGEEAMRQLATLGRLPLKTTNQAAVEAAYVERVQLTAGPIQAAYASSREPLQAELDASRAEDANLAAGVTALKRKLIDLAQARADAERVLAEYQRHWLAFVVLAGGLVLLLAGASSLITALLRTQRSAIPYYAAAAACMLCFVVGLSLVQQGWLSAPEAGIAQPEQEMLPYLGQAEPVPPDLARARPGTDEGKGVPAPGPVAPVGPPAENPDAKTSNGKARGFSGRVHAPAVPGANVPPAPISPHPKDAQALVERSNDRLRQWKELTELNQKLRLEKESADAAFGGPGKGGAGTTKLDGGPPAMPRPESAPGESPPRHFEMRPVPPAPLSKPGAPAKDNVADKSAAEAPQFYVREYRHENRFRKSGLKDYTDTVYWHPALVLPSGKAVIDFELNDAATSYELWIIGHTLDGRFGSKLVPIEAKPR